MQEVVQVGNRLNTIQQGDCVERLREVAAGSVDLVFADPPFNIGYEYDVYDDQQSSGEYLDWSKQWITGVHKALKADGTFWLAIGDEYAAELKVLSQQVGFSCRSWVIWYYTFGVNCVRGFSRSHTHLFHLVKDKENFTFNAHNPAVRVPSARQLVYADIRANPRGRLPDNTWILRPQDAPPPAFDASHDTWYYARVAGTFKEREGFHGCQMPEQLLGRIIRSSSNPGEVVLDPFGGSGTTLVVAKKLARQWMGIELSKEYVKHIKGRLKKTQVGEPLDGPENPVKSAPTTAKGKKNVIVRGGRPLPKADAETEERIILAYREVADGASTDYLLCDPELNAQFVAACKKRNLPGGAVVWNRLLLRIRKTGKLPRSKRSGTRISRAAMDAYSFASEIAMQLIGLDYALKLDDMLCDPKIAAEFDKFAESFAPGHSPLEYRWAAMAIRKRALTAKKLAQSQCADWLDKKLPRSIPLTQCRSEKHDRPGVYILSNHNQQLYVGETNSLRDQIERIASTKSWSDFDPRSTKFIPTEDQRQRHGLQSLLIQRTNPLLNSSLLRAEMALATV
jgi:site-specific DNA-methyltransferase (adenine-specific)